MKKSLFCLILVLSFFYYERVSAQKNFVDGYVITVKKDTLKGHIDYREWNLNPSLINFTDNAGNKSIFRPDDISGFFITPNDHFISSHVSLDLSSLQAKDLMEFKESRSVKDTALFLLTLVKGKACLFYLKDRNDREHFFVSVDETQPAELLLKKKYVTSSEGSTVSKNYVATVELFKGQLIVLLNDCPDLKEFINRSDYSAASMQAVVVRYNQCRKSTIEFVKKEEQVKIKFGLLVGATLTKVTFKGAGDDLIGMKMTDSYSFLAGVSLHLIFPLERAQWSLLNEFVYKSYSNSGTSSETTWNKVKYDRTFSFNVAYLKLYTVLRYQYPQWKVRPFADFGISNGYAIQSKNTKTVTETFQGKVTTTTGPAIPDPKLYEFGILGGIGVSWWKISGEVRYEWAQGMSPFSEMKGYENTFSLVVSYLF